MTAIFKKELASYLHSVTGWLFMAATIGFFAMYASVYNMLYGFPYIAYPLDAILILFLLQYRYCLCGLWQTSGVRKQISFC